jgi:ribosomal protein S6--L-glutamate ligase
MDAEQVIYRIGPKSYSSATALLSQLSDDRYDELNRFLKAFDKREIFRILSDASLPTPDSWIMKKGERYQDRDFVIKIPNGNQGRGIELIHNQQELDMFYTTYANEESYLAQEFIQEASAQDKRLLVVGDEVVAAMRRVATNDDFRANLHTGGKAEPYTATQEEKRIAIESVKVFGLRYAGVDIIDSNRGPLVLEVNPSPGFGISIITGVDVASTVIKNYMGE